MALTAVQEVANFVNSKTSKPTSSTEQAYNKAKKTLDSNLKAAQARWGHGQRSG